MGQWAQLERRAQWLSASPRVTRSAPMAWGLRARVPAAAGSLPCALRAWRQRRGRCEPWRLHLLDPPANLRVLPLVGGDVEDVVRFALLETLGATRASSSCRGRGTEGGVAHREELAAATSATLERSAGMVADRDGTRGRLASGVAPVGKGSRRRRAGCARPAGRGRLERASEDLWWWVVRTPTSNYLRLASPNRGKYLVIPRM